MNFKPGKNGKRDLLFLAVLSIVVFVLGASSIRDKSVTVDEPNYVGVGYYLLKTHNFLIEPITTHPPLSYYINSIPLYILYMGNALPEKERFLSLDGNEKYYVEIYNETSRDCFYCYAEKYGYNFIYGKEYQRYNLFFYSRCSMLLLLILCIIYLFRALKEFYGFETACIVTTIFALNPNILAHASLATTDIAPVCFNMVSFYYFLKFMRSKTNSNGMKTGISLGLALLSKASSLYLVLVYAVIICVDSLKSISTRTLNLSKRHYWDRAKTYTLLILSTLMVLDTGYLFQGVPSDFFIRYEPGNFLHYTSKVYEILRGIPMPIPDTYILMVEATDVHIELGHANYFEGMSNKNFGMVYWIQTFLLKNPEGTLLLLLIGAAYYAVKLIFKKKVYPKTSATQYYTAVNILVFTLLLTRVDILIGIRLILPLFPMVFLLLGEPVKFLLAGRFGRIIVYLLFIASLIPTVAYFPNYISYFNQIIGGPENGYKYFSGSSIDWGQDLSGVKGYMDKNNISTIKLAYFGSGKVEEYGINYTPLPNNFDSMVQQCGPTTGMLAISVTSLSGQLVNPHCYDWLKNFKPIDNIGYSILIYNITKRDLIRVGLLPPP
jgi:hypothetical protein